MLGLPNDYLALVRAVRKPFRVTPAELASGVVDWWDRLADRMMSDGLAWRVLLVVLWLITILWAYNVGLNAG